MGIWGWLFLVDENGLKVLLCVFLDDVVCSFRKDARFGVMSRCFKCRHYLRFEMEMDEENELVMNEIDEIRKHPETFSREDLR